jgi:hypothetical protein
MKKTKMLIAVVLFIAGVLTILMAPNQFNCLGFLAIILSTLVEHCWQTE